jgi:hypothetical protein
MDEPQWLACADPDRMLTFLQDTISARKLRLFACACCRLIEDVLGEELRRALEVAERYADGLADIRERKAALQAVRHVVLGKWLGYRKQAVDRALAHRPRDAARFASRLASLPDGRDGYSTYRAVQAGLLRDIVGNPFRRTQFDPLWRGGDGAPSRLAEAAYRERRFDLLPVLADALEEAGCSSAEILDHCRRPGAHVRGCWVVDQVLGRT